MANETTMTTGEAAAYLTTNVGDLSRTGGFSRQTVRRLIEAGELSSSWSREATTKDRNGRRIRGHRRLSRDSVVAYARRLREASQDQPVKG